MNWHILVAIIIAGALSTLSDFFFFGVLFRSRYAKYPETWWPGVAEGKETRAIVLSSVLDFVVAAAVIGLCMFAGVHNIRDGLIVGALAAVAGPLVITVTNGFWIRIDPAIIASQAVGYCLRFLIAGVAAGYVLS